MSEQAQCSAFNVTTYLGARAGQVRTKHDSPRSLVRELLASGLETILEELEVTTTAVATLLVLDLVLNDEGLLREVNSLGKRSRDGVVGSFGLGHETFVVLDDGVLRVLDLPLADVAEGFTANGGLLGGLGRSPPVSPVVCELFEERSLDSSGLYACRCYALSSVHALRETRTLNAGLESSATTPVTATTSRADSATLRIVYEGP